MVLEFTGSFKKNPARKRAREGEPQPKGGLGAPPRYFTADDRECWNALKKAAPKGVHTTMDRPTAEVIARLWARFRRNELNAAEISTLARLMGQHGMTPATRSTVKVPTEGHGKQRQDPAQKYLTA
jgi:hypothetical protein